MTADGGYLLVTLGAGGNVPPFLGLTRRLVERGHSVRLLGDSSLRSRAEAVGAVFCAAPDPEWDPSWGRAFEDNLAAAQAILLGPVMADALLDEVRRDPPDVILVDSLLLNAIAAAEATGKRTAVLLHTRYGYPFEVGDPWAPTLEMVNEMRARFALPSLEPSSNEPTRPGMWRRSHRILAALPRELDDRDVPLPSNLRYVGPIFAEEADDFSWESPWPPNDHRPLVVLSFGTTYMHQEQAIERVLDALAGLKVRTLLLLGSALRADEVAQRRGVVVCDYVPHRAVLPRAALIVTHGGMGTILAALASGMPLVCVPLGRDQVGNAHRVQALGVGRAADHASSVDDLRSTIVGVLRSEATHVAARRIADVLLGYGSGTLAVEELETLLAEAKRVG